MATWDGDGSYHSTYTNPTRGGNDDYTKSTPAKRNEERRSPLYGTGVMRLRTLYPNMTGCFRTC